MASKSKSTFVSPVDDNFGALPEAAFAIVNSFTAEPVAVSKANSFPLVSKIEVPILGAVIVLFVKVCVPVVVTTVLGNTSVPPSISKVPKTSNVWPAGTVTVFPAAPANGALTII